MYYLASLLSACVASHMSQVRTQYLAMMPFKAFERSRAKRTLFRVRSHGQALSSTRGSWCGYISWPMSMVPRIETYGRTLKYSLLEKKEKHCMANIIEKARAEHAYNKYVKGLESVAGLVDTLSGPGPFTIFIPTDAAFDSMSDDQQANLFADPGKLAKVLKYHIVPGYYTADDLLDRLFLKTLEGQRLRVWSDVSEVPLGEEEIATGRDALNYIASDTVTTSVRESIKINGGHVVQANVIADNGIMHVIDKVLIPQFTML